MGDWISVEDRLPGIGEGVLAYRPMAEATQDPRITITIYQGRGQDSPQGVVHGFRCWCHPSHWMPLPEPPKEPTND